MNFETLRLTALVNGLSLLKIPLLAFASPRVVEINDSKSVISVALGWRTRNHLGGMYFGALAMGAELSIALKAVQEIQKSPHKIDFIFKRFSSEFVKRADGPVHFVCDEASDVSALIKKAEQTSERLEGTFKGYAYVASRPDERIMDYSLTLSVKKRG